jgi:hypothetical protein
MGRWQQDCMIKIASVFSATHCMDHLVAQNGCNHLLRTHHTVGSKTGNLNGGNSYHPKE